MASLNDITTRDDIHPALRGFAMEASAVVVRLMAYVGGLAALAWLVADIYGTQHPVAATSEPVAKPGWIEVAKPMPAFSVAQADFGGKTAAYSIRRHPEGGRKDSLIWSFPGEPTAAEIELFRPGLETPDTAPMAPDLAIRMGLLAAGEAESAGVIDSKFGPISLVRFPAQENRQKPCLGFTKSFDGQRLQLTGFACQADSVPAQRAFIGCLLNRLTLIAAGSDAKLAETFARAELKRGGCNTAPVIGDWAATLQEPLLRGRL